MPLDCLVLMTRGSCAPGPHRTITIRKIVLGRVSYPGLWQTEIRPQSEHERSPFNCPGASTEGQASGLVHIQRLQKCSRGTQAGRHHVYTFPWPCHSLLLPPRKEFIHLSEAPVLTTVAQGTPPDLLVWKSTGSMTMVPWDYVYVFVYFKSCCLWSGFHSAWI